MNKEILEQFVVMKCSDFINSDVKKVKIFVKRYRKRPRYVIKYITNSILGGGIMDQKDKKEMVSQSAEIALSAVSSLVGIAIGGVPGAVVSALLQSVSN